MKYLQAWTNSLQCSDCHRPLRIASSDTVSCSGCGRKFEHEENIWNMLPSKIAHQEGKDREQEGWTQKTEKDKKAGWEPPPEHYLSLPDHPHPYYQSALWYLKIVLECGKPWTDKRVLELGAAECWGTRHFAEAGAEAAALDYDPERMKKGQILLDHLPVRFARFRGDAESLPFRDGSLDRIFCCSVLHHFFDLPKAVKEISRTLRPGGIFFGIHEAFHPPYYTKEQILNMSEDNLPNISEGIHEDSYPLHFYRKVFCKAGMTFELIHPRWDVSEKEGKLKVSPGHVLYNNPDYIPEMFGNRIHRQDIPGKIARLILGTGIWRLAAHPAVFPLIRFQLLNWTLRDKVIVARKPG